MADLQVFDFNDAEWGDTYDAPFCKVSGEFRAKTAQLVDYSLWTVDASLSPGASVQWSGDHGDEIVMVLSGALDVDGVRVPTLGSIVVEAGVDAAATALERTEILHWGPTDPAAPADSLVGPPRSREAGERGVHLHGERGKAHREMTFMDEQLDSVLHADSMCPTCRPTLLRVIARGPMTFPSHLHSQDEVIYVRDGGFKVGPLTARPGMLLAIPAGRRYGIRSDTNFEFLNYRRDVSTITMAPGSEPTLEVGEGRGYESSPAFV
jgi:hypothetical protein